MERPTKGIRALARIGLMLAALGGAATPPDSPFGFRPPAVQDMRKRRSKPPKSLRGIVAYFLPWKVMEKMGWTRDGRGDIRNPRREARRRADAAYLAHTGRHLSGRQWVRLRRGH